jgi:tetratricopeptide (TPR) repeat protein
MKKLLLCFVLLSPVYAFTQFLAADATLVKAKKKATAKGKPIALLMKSADCSECNSVAEKSLQNASLHQLLANDFVVLQVAPGHKDRSYIQGAYNYSDGNMVLFLDGSGTLIHRMNKSTTRYEDYIDECKKALLQQATGAVIRSLEKAGLEGKLDNETLLDLMQKRKALSLPIDSLLELYATRLSTDSFYTAHILQEVARLSPILQSKADKAMRKDKDLFNQAWYGMSIEERVTINQQIIRKTLNRAIQEKNSRLAYEAANFSRQTNNNAVAGKKAYVYNWLEYTRGTRDTSEYLVSAVSYYDEYYMSMSADSIRVQDSMALAKHFRSTTDRDTLIRTRTSMTVRKTVSMSGLAQSVSRTLSQAARDMYNMTKDTMYLRKALSWSEYANSLYPNSEAMDIYARLLFVLDNNTAKAIELEEQAIALREKRGLDSKVYATTLENLKKGKL